MKLTERLAEMAAASKEKIPADLQVIMKAHLDSINGSGQVERALSVGQTMPSFGLEGPDGMVSSSSLLEGGHLILTFFRGSW